MTIQLAPRPVTPADLPLPSSAPRLWNREPEPTYRFLVKSFQGWVLRTEDGRTVGHDPELFELLNSLPRPAEGLGRHYLITAEPQVTAHERLIQEATGWVAATPFNSRVEKRLRENVRTARQVFAASDASLLGVSKGAVAYAVFDGRNLTLGGYSTDLRRTRQCAHPGIDRLETIAALEALHVVQGQLPWARVVLGTDSRRAQSTLLELPEMTASHVGAHLQEAALPIGFSPAHPVRHQKAAQRAREKLRERSLRLTWVRSHTLNEESEKIRTLEDVRALPERIIMRELNVLADQTARALNSARSQATAQRSTCQGQLAALVATRFPGAQIRYRF